MNTDNIDSRTIAARIISNVIKDGKSLDKILSAHTEQIQDHREKAFIQELCYGVLRWYFRLEFFLDNLLNKSLKPKDSDIKALILSGLYQLEFMRTPAHAAVSSSVGSATQLNKPWAKSMINAVLRRYQREQKQFNQSITNNETANYAHPQWLIDRIREDWPDYWQGILETNNQRPPMHLRVNLSRTDRNSYLQTLAEIQQLGETDKRVPSSIKLVQAVDIKILPGFVDGNVSVQDSGAQLAAPLLDLQKDQRVLDACAAPGGKTAHILEIQPQINKLIALDSDAKRAQLLEATKERLNLDVEILQADARSPDLWWDGKKFDRILLDAPCSATGVIRRHPDIKLLRNSTDISQFGITQHEILESLWPLLKLGGKLVYVTCSLIRQENDLQIENFLNTVSDAHISAIDASWGVATRYGRQTIPGQDDMDGFYYAVLEKT